MSSNSTEVAPPAPHTPLFESCWSCRLLSGLALIGSGIWVYLGSRKVRQQRAPPNVLHVAQMTFALGLAYCGVLLIADPFEKQKQKGE
ncbi:distal membrane-arm assembly complex protein 1-like [Heteronotia binoei]|uniref:distal membrane-arm assembly complex protein 1-like n=1 Tax=Heteronotia binoei TaxID=13085 RepID=UPI0029315F64|nr:distal membrane-arm assembly complex protein 1-like [Heteronotia binoei]